MAAVFDPVILDRERIFRGFRIDVIRISNFRFIRSHYLRHSNVRPSLQHQSFDWTVAFFALEFGSTLPAHHSLLRVVSHARCFFRG